MDATAIVAVVALLVALIATSVEYLSFRGISKKIDQETEKMEERGTIGEQIGEWLLYSESENEPCNLDVVARRLAHFLVVGVNAQVAGVASGDARRQKMVDNRLFNAMQEANPDMKLVGTVLEKLGLEELNQPELMPYVLSWFRKNGGAGLLGKVSPSSHSKKGSDAFKI